MAVTPKSRGLEKEEPKIFATPNNATHITKVIDHGPGWMTVELGDGNRYKLEGGSLAWRCRNPGNLKFGEFAKKHGAVAEGHNDMAVFPTVAHGKAAMKELLFGDDSRYRNLTVRKAMSIYAPDYDGNDSDRYAEFVLQTAKLSNQKTLGLFTNEERERMMAAMQKMEGFTAGNISKVSK